VLVLPFILGSTAYLTVPTGEFPLGLHQMISNNVPRVRNITTRAAAVVAGYRLSLRKGDITLEECGAIVNAANGCFCQGCSADSSFRVSGWHTTLVVMLRILLSYQTNHTERLGL